MTEHAFAAGAMHCHVTRLRLANFRSYASLGLKLEGISARPVVLVGANGAGKTNLLEAVSYLAPGRGLRGAKLTDVTRIGSSAPWAVHAHLTYDDDDVELGTGLAPGHSSIDDEDEPGSGNRRIVRIDGAPASGPAALGDYVAMLWLTPAMDRLFTEGASGRRRFLDRIVLALHSDHGRQVNSYERAMRERNRLLDDRGASADPAWLTALEARMAEAAVAIAAARCETLHHLDRRLSKGGKSEGPFPRAHIAVDGWVEDQLALGSALEAEDAFKDHLARMRPRDAAAGRTLDGPHRSDLLVRHVLKDMPAHLCSTGEQKGLLIAIVLAHARLAAEQAGRMPIMLLDEVAAHLDEQRRSALFEQILELGCQAWVTGTDRHLFTALAGHADAFRVEDGCVRACQLI